MSKEKGCKFNCNNGRIFDPKIQQWVLCPECKGEREQELVEPTEDVVEVLGFDPSLFTGNYLPKTVLPLSEQQYIDEEAWKMFMEESENLFNTLLRGEVPGYSMCFGLKVKGNPELLINPMMMKGYQNGLSVGKLTTAISLERAILNQEDISEVYSNDLQFILINEGSSRAAISVCKGVMQERAVRGRATIMVTTWDIEAISNLLSTYGTKSKYLAEPVFLKYKYNDKKQSKYINDLYGQENSIHGQNEVSFNEFDDIISNGPGF